MIETIGLSKQFDNNFAVSDLDLSVEPGEVFAFLGPNGAGKTTTVRLLTALIKPTSGAAWIDGHELGVDNKAIRSSVGILTEAPGLYERLNAVQNLTLYARLYEVENVERQVQKYLQLLDLWARRTEPVGGFSKGMKQKLAIARALLHEPNLLFLDEPTAALDPEASRTVRDFIRNIKGAGRTIFLCTHNLDEADRLADRVGVIRQKLIQVDSPANLRKRLYGRRISIKLSAITQDILDMLESLKFIKSIEQMDNTLVLDIENPEMENPILITRLVEAGGQIQFVQEMSHSLEDIYFTLLKEDDASKGKKDIE